MTRDRLSVCLRVRTAITLGVLVGLALGVPALAIAASEGGHSLIEINRSLIVQLVNFLILLAVLWKLLYRPLMTALAGRTAAIKDQLAEAQAAREDAQRQLAGLEERLRASQAEAQAVRDRALREAAEVRERLTAEARQEAARLVESAQAQIGQDVRRARNELRAEVGLLATQVAERLIRKSLTDDDHQRIVRDALARIESA